MQRVPWYENRHWVLPALIASLGILALVVLVSLIRLGRRIVFRKRPRWVPQPGTLWLTASPRLAAFGWILLLGTIAGWAAAESDDLMPPTPAWYPWFQAINVATAIIMVFSLFAVFAAIRIWFRADLRRITKIKFLFVAVAVSFLSWFAIHWNIIGPAHRI